MSGSNEDNPLDNDASAAADDIVTDRTDDLWRTVLRRQRGPLSWVANFPDDPDDN